MAQILVRNLNEKLMERLKKRAKREGRTLQSEVKMILEHAANEQKLDLKRVNKILENMRKEFKGKKFSDSVDLIREDRDR